MSGAVSFSPLALVCPGKLHWTGKSSGTDKGTDYHMCFIYSIRHFIY